MNASVFSNFVSIQRLYLNMKNCIVQNFPVFSNTYFFVIWEWFYNAF